MVQRMIFTKDYIYKIDFVNQLTLGKGNYNQTDHDLTKLSSCVLYCDINLYDHRMNASHFNQSI
jgi:hypothetical protein